MVLRKTQRFGRGTSSNTLLLPGIIVGMAGLYPENFCVKLRVCPRQQETSTNLKILEIFIQAYYGMAYCSRDTKNGRKNTRRFRNQECYNTSRGCAGSVGQTRGQDHNTLAARGESCCEASAYFDIGLWTVLPHSPAWLSSCQIVLPFPSFCLWVLRFPRGSCGEWRLPCSWSTCSSWS